MPGDYFRENKTSRCRAPSRTWRRLSVSTSVQFRNLLIHAGGAEDREILGSGEAWRVRVGCAVFTGYSTGTVYCPGGAEPELQFLYSGLDELQTRR
jgi:hypothetical protein